MGVEIGVDLDALIDLSKSLPEMVVNDVPGQVAEVGPIWRLHGPPTGSDRPPGNDNVAT
jgi:hydroxymethylglutaryl-CoA lyase